MKTCPFCAEEIQSAAIKCKHCGEMLSEPDVVHRPAINQDGTIDRNVAEAFRDYARTRGRHPTNYGLILAVVIFIAVILFAAVMSVTSESPDQDKRGSSTSRPAPQPSNETTITKTDFGAAWPFTVSDGVLSCKGSRARPEVTFTTGGVTYAINGTARSSGRYSEVDAVWANDPTITGAKKSVGPIIDRGLRLCR